MAEHKGSARSSKRSNKRKGPPAEVVGKGSDAKRGKPTDSKVKSPPHKKRGGAAPPFDVSTVPIGPEDRKSTILKLWKEKFVYDHFNTSEGEVKSGYDFFLEKNEVKGDFRRSSFPNDDVKFGNDLGYFAFALEKFIFPVKKISAMFWVGAQTQEQLRQIVLRCLVEQMKEGVALAPTANVRSTFYILVQLLLSGMTVDFFMRQLHEFQLEGKGGLSSEQVKVLNQVNTLRSAVRKKRSELQGVIDAFRKKVRETLTDISKMQDDLAEQQKPLDKFVETMSGVLTTTERSQLHQRFLVAEAKARKDGKGISPFQNVLAKAQFQKAMRNKSLLIDNFRELPSESDYNRRIGELEAEHELGLSAIRDFDPGHQPSPAAAPGDVDMGGAVDGDDDVFSTFDLRAAGGGGASDHPSGAMDQE